MTGDDMNSDHDTIAFSGPTLLWPPNHRYRTVTITATDVDSPISTGNSVHLSTTATSDQPDVGLGSGGPKHANDATPATQMSSGSGSVTQTVQLRGERAGKLKSGRTYTLDVEATFDDTPFVMDPCHATFTVTVPHDMGNH